MASFFSVFLKFNYSQEIKYVFHDKNNLIPYTIKNDHLKNIPLESKVLKNISTEVKYVKLNRAPTKDFVKNALSNDVEISGVEIIETKKKISKINHPVVATDLANINPTSLLTKSLAPSEVSKTTISGVDLIKDKNPIIYPDKNENIELLADKQNQFIEDSLWNSFSENRDAEYEAQEIADLEESAAQLLAEEEENQRISDSLEEAERLLYFETQKLADETAARIFAYQQETQRIADSLADAQELAEFEAQQLADETAARIFAYQQETQRIADSLADAQQLAEFEAQQLAEETAEKLLAEEQETQRIADSLAEAQQLAEFEAQQLAEESAAQLLAEEQEPQLIVDSLAEAQQLAEFEAQQLPEESAAKLSAEEEENQRISDSLAEALQLAELEAQRLAEETAEKLLAEEEENQRISDSLAEALQLAEFEAQRLAEEKAEKLLADEQESQRIADSLADAEQLAELEQQRKNEEARLLAEQEKMIEQNNQIFAESQIDNNEELSEMYTAPNVEYDEYYTIKLTTVYSPMEGISFLNNVRDGDEIWKENAFHLYQDEYNSDLTNISIGKFSNLDDADIVINKLKNKGLTNAKAIKYTNKIKLNTAANSVKKKSVSNPVVKTTVVKPSEKTVVNNITDNSTNENLAIKTVKKPSSNLKNNSVKKENKSIETKDIETENAFSNISKEVNKEQDFFTVQLAAVSEITSDRINTINLDKKQLFYQNINAGNYALNYKKFSNYGEAHTKAIELHGKGFEGAYVAKYVNNKRTAVTKSDLSNDNVSESTIETDLKGLGYRPLNLDRKGKYIQIGSFYNWDSHSYQDTYESINNTIYFTTDNSKIVKFLVGPFTEQDIYIELRNIKKTISDAFIKTI